jgi:serine/threonine-protein kinase
VLDFGIAKATNPALGNSSQTRTGAILGTPYYMSPEQAEGNRSIDHRTDLWSLAVIAFECVTGRKPFQSEALGDLILQICVKPIKKPSAFEAVPPAFDDWFAKATQREPAQRFQSARELTAGLRAAAGVQVVGETARLPLTGKDTSERSAAQRFAESASGGALNATTGGVGGVAHTSARPTSRQQMSKPVIVSATLGALTLAGTVGFFALRSAGQAASGSAPSSSVNVATAFPAKATTEVPAVEQPKPAEPRASAEATPPAEAPAATENRAPPDPKAKAAAATPPAPGIRARAKAAPVAQPPTPAKPVEKSVSTSKRVDFGF